MANHDAHGRFLPGNTIGKLGGRPKGASDFRTALGDEGVAAVVKAVREGVEAGDARFVALAIDRLFPALTRTEVGGIEGKPIALEHAETAAESLPTDVLRELDQLAEKLNAAKGNGKAVNGSGTEH